MVLFDISQGKNYNEIDFARQLKDDGWYSTPKPLEPQAPRHRAAASGSSAFRVDLKAGFALGALGALVGWCAGMSDASNSSAAGSMSIGLGMLGAAAGLFWRPLIWLTVTVLVGGAVLLCLAQAFGGR